MTTPDPQDILGDSTALRDLLRMAGPETAPRILRQMHSDLTDCATLLAPALATGDRIAIRAQTHVLIALAGTIGAMRLHALAIDLNAAAHAEDAAAIARHAAPLQHDLTGLIALLAARLPKGEAAA